jgi:antitoxin component of MazEF toxin-antitoxin module
MQTLAVVQLEQVGDEAYLPLSNEILDLLNWRVGDAVDVRVENGQIIISRIDAPGKPH